VIVRRAAGWLDERFGTNALVHVALRKIYPDHWSFYLGEFALYFFLVLAGTGIWLTFAFDASSQNAYASVLALPIAIIRSATSSARSITGPPCVSSPQSSCTWAGFSLPAHSGGRASSTGWSASWC